MRRTFDVQGDSMFYNVLKVVSRKLTTFSFCLIFANLKV